MWDDEPAPWDTEESAPATEEGAAAEGEAPAEGAASEKPVLKLEKIEPPHYNHHWVRPLFLNYAYLYDYRYVSRIEKLFQVASFKNNRLSTHILEFSNLYLTGKIIMTT